jgi:hypothetical protein
MPTREHLIQSVSLRKSYCRSSPTDFGETPRILSSIIAPADRVGRSGGLAARINKNPAYI